PGAVSCRACRRPGSQGNRTSPICQPTRPGEVGGRFACGTRANQSLQAAGSRHTIARHPVTTQSPPPGTAPKSDRARRGCGLAALAHGRGGRRPREMELCRRAAIVLAAIMLIPGLAAASPTLDRIASRGRMVMAVDADYPPFSFMKDDQLQGFD